METINPPEQADLPPIVSEQELLTRGRKILRRRFVTVGGGLGSMAIVHLWRIAGVADEDLCVVGPLESPKDTYEYLANNSQIPRDERLRSDSGSTIDAIWGWPGYALRESAGTLNPTQALRVLGEPVVAEFFTPKASQVYDSVDRESARLGWDRIRQPGWVEHIRKAENGGYWVLAESERDGSLAIYCQFVHIAVGYPGVALLADLKKFRTDYPESGFRIVNAYEPHGFLYDELAKKPSVVLVRGSGIVASRVLQRLLDDVETSGHQTTVVHLFRNYVGENQGSSPMFRRRGKGGFAYQAFNYPKASWGGQLRARLETLEGEERAELIDQMGGTNTAPRRAWRKQLKRHQKTGAYRQAHGQVVDVVPHGDGVRTVIKAKDGSTEEIDATYVLDATGLQADPTTHWLYADLIARSGARRNPKGRLAVEPSFEITGTSSGTGRMFASGAMTLGGHYAGVDSFLGLQYAALQAVDEMAACGAFKRIGPIRSAKHWCGWALNRSYNSEGTLS